MTQPVITVTRSPSRTTLAFITFPPGLLHEGVTHAEVSIEEDGLMVHFRDGGDLLVKGNRLTLPPDMAWLFAPGRSDAVWVKIDASTIILEVEK